jgi:aspartyl-tRNA(Asn)/glutamyl-tRNA(Gln) amidotransferase subunit A
MRGINIIGIPALAIRCGFTKGGMPIGLQLIAGAYQEDRLFQVGAAIEDATALTDRLMRF